MPLTRVHWSHAWIVTAVGLLTVATMQAVKSYLWEKSRHRKDSPRGIVRSAITGPVFLTNAHSVTLESNMTTARDNLTRIQYWDDRETPDNTGWYICHFGDFPNLMANSPEDVIGPYDTQAEAIRVYNETLTLDAEEEHDEKKVRPYDPSRDKVVLKMSDDETDIRVQSEERHEGGLSEPVQSVREADSDPDTVDEAAS